MMDPITLGVAAVSIASTAYGAYTSYKGAQQQAAAAQQTGQYQAGMYNYQAGVNYALAGAQDTQARLQLASGEVAAQQAGEVSRASVGREITETGAGGLGITSGSPSRVTASQVAIGQENEALARATAAQTAYGSEVQAASYRAQAGAEQVAAKEAVIAGGIGASAEQLAATGAAVKGIGSVASGFGSVADKWYQRQQTTPTATALPPTVTAYQDQTTALGA